MAIKLDFQPAFDPLFAQSKWWGAADLPSDWDYPRNEEGEPLHFLCQIRCEELIPYDKQGLLPHAGMLYFFAAIGEYIEHLDLAEGHCGLGEWPQDAFRVLHAPSCDNLRSCPITYDDGEAAYLPAERIIFSEVESSYDRFKLLGRPYYEEIAELYPDSLSLLQIDEEERWGLRLYDCGMLCFLITPEALRHHAWEEVRLYFHSF